jgi:solute carrier family 35 protein E3
MESAHSTQAWDVMSWFLNVSSSVVIVFANKVLLDAKSGHGFAFGTSTHLFSATMHLL